MKKICAILLSLLTGVILLADNLLKNLATNEPDGILATTFINGLLGQSLTFFAQAKQLATQSNQ